MRSEPLGCSGRVISTRQKSLRHFPDARVVRGHDDFAQRLGLPALLDDVLDERLAGNERERLAGKRVEA